MTVLVRSQCLVAGLLALAAVTGLLPLGAFETQLAQAPAGGPPSVSLTTHAPQAAVRPADLLDLAANSPAAIAELFAALAVPSDRVQLAGGEWTSIKPLPADTLLDADFAGSVVAKTIAEDGQLANPLVLTRAGVTEYVPYERQVLERTAAFQKTATELPMVQRLAAVEAVLAAALRFHGECRDNPIHGHNRWQPVRTEVDRALLTVRRELFRERTTVIQDAKEWLRALRWCEELVAAYPAQADVLADVGRLRLRYAAAILLGNSSQDAKNTFEEIRRQLQWTEDHCPQLSRQDAWHALGASLGQAGQLLHLLYQPDGDRLRAILVHRALALLAAARATTDNRAAIKLLQAAEQVWPRLPGLHDELCKRQGRYTILYVGVRSLPTHFSPAQAVADSELQALELLFEGLASTRLTSDGASVHVPQLAVALAPAPEAERRIDLRKTAYWSNGARVTGADVQRSFELLTTQGLPGRNAELSDQLEPLRLGEDPFRVVAKLRQGLLDPLAPFTFKVLPREYAGMPLAAANSEAFALAPLGSGPYMLAGKQTEHGREYVRFVVNPYYRAANGAAELPIREVRFFVSKDPVADFAHKTAPLHLLLDVRPLDLAKVKAAGAGEVRALRTRRVHFLAVNHRDKQLADTSLRRALAHALDRHQLLESCFGNGAPAPPKDGVGDGGAHQPLNGPFPAGSWACCLDKRVEPSLFDRVQAETLLKGTKDEPLDLELKYPKEDPCVEKACQAIAAEWADFGNRCGRSIVVKLVALPIRELYRDLQLRKFQLAYWHYDFPDDLYSLWPLFDPRDEALATGSNYLGFRDDGILTELLQKAAAHRDFAEVKRLAHDIHAAFNERMPLIPLWQLDDHIAVHPHLTLPRVDPVRIFANIEEWQLQGKP